jgi:hypothetical protein
MVADGLARVKTSKWAALGVCTDILFPSLPRATRSRRINKLGMKQEDDVRAQIKSLYPTLNEDGLREAEYALRRYFEIAWEIQRERENVADEFDSSPDARKIKERSIFRSNN